MRKQARGQAQSWAKDSHQNHSCQYWEEASTRPHKGINWNKNQISSAEFIASKITSFKKKERKTSAHQKNKIIVFLKKLKNFFFSSFHILGRLSYLSREYFCKSRAESGWWAFLLKAEGNPAWRETRMKLYGTSPVAGEGKEQNMPWHTEHVHLQQKAVWYIFLLLF